MVTMSTEYEKLLLSFLNSCNIRCSSIHELDNLHIPRELLVNNNTYDSIVHYIPKFKTTAQILPAIDANVTATVYAFNATILLPTAIDAVADGDVDAAIIPSFMVSKYKFLKVITTTKATPNIALSVSPAVPTDFKKNILNALINADKSFEGRSMLKRIGLPKFADTSDTKYSGYSQLLEGMFGYQPSVKLKMAVSE